MSTHTETQLATEHGLYGDPDPAAASLKMVAPRPWAWRLALTLLGLISAAILTLVLTPWQQSVTGTGKVIVYSVMDRPQNVEAQIPGRLARWHVQEGQSVRAGELIAELTDIDSKFLDTDQVNQMQRQREALLARRLAAEARAVALTSQLASAGRSRDAALPTAGERSMQANERVGAAREALTASEQGFSAAKQVALPGAREKVHQAEDRLQAAEAARAAAEQSLKAAREVVIPTADERALQAVDRQRAAEEALTAAQQSLRAARDVAIPSAAEKYGQALDKKRQAEQSLTAAKQNLVTARLNRERIGDLYRKTLRSRRDDELAELELVRGQTEVERAQAALQLAERDIRVARLDQDKAQVDLERSKTEVERAKAAVEIARRDTSVGGLEQSRAQVDAERVKTELDRARAGVEIARRDVRLARLELDRAEMDVVRSGTEVERSKVAVGLARRDAVVGDLDQVKIEADTAASVSSIQASVASARETIASITSDILKLEVELQNTRLRRQQQWVRAPRNGRVVRLMKAGAGETVKAGDVMAVLAPDTPERAVELYLSDNDAPLVEVGRPVRLQFAGWPALQFTGWPSVAVGTFAGKVAVVDAIDDGTSRYRIIVTPDDAGGQDDQWPDARYLRPGGEATGWVMLDTVSLGFELWRQFNAFPPTVERGPIGKDKSGAGGDQKAEKEGQIKRKAGK